MSVKFRFLLLMLICTVPSALSVGCQRSTRVTVATLAPSVERPPYDPNATQKTLEFWSWKVKQDPQGAIEYGRLAGIYLERCRETGDIADALKAEQAARRSLTIRARNNVAGRDMLALSLLTQHRFGDASAIARQTYLMRPDDLQSLYLDVEASIEMGDYRHGEGQLAHLDGVPDSPFSAALRARLCEMKGKPQVALEYLLSARKQADEDLELSRPAVAWFHMRVADILAAMGKSQDAETAYREAVEIFPRDYKAMTSLSRLAACRHDWAQSITWGVRAADIVPAPDTLTLLGDAYSAMGRAMDANRQYRLIESIARIAQDTGTVYDRQRALYYADHDRQLGQALALAQRELVIRHDVYAYDTLAWAAYKNHRLGLADQAAASAMACGTRDASILFHAGMIANALNRRERARLLLTTALAINPQFHPRDAATARNILRKLGDRA
jgi:tetratricopeptide (TPR) repeat protein